MILARRAEVHVATMAFCIHEYLASHSVVQDRPSVIRALITDWGHVDRRYREVLVRYLKRP
jgi:hypothetical protein